MFNVGKLFHLAHLVDDLDAVDRWYDEIFSCVRFYRAYEKAALREASLLVISDMLMEPIMPSQAPEAAGAEEVDRRVQCLITVACHARTLQR